MIDDFDYTDFRSIGLDIISFKQSEDPMRSFVEHAIPMIPSGVVTSIEAEIIDMKKFMRIKENADLIRAIDECDNPAVHDLYEKLKMTLELTDET